MTSHRYYQIRISFGKTRGAYKEYMVRASSVGAAISKATAGYCVKNLSRKDIEIMTEMIIWIRRVKPSQGRQESGLIL